MVWKVVIHPYDLIGGGLAWRVGNERKVRIGSDPWEICGQKHILPTNFQNLLHDRGIFYLNLIVDPLANSVFSQGCITSSALILDSGR